MDIDKEICERMMVDELHAEINKKSKRQKYTSTS